VTQIPTFDDLKRGHVVLAPDPFKDSDELTRPWVVVNNETHPFDSEQYIVMGLTTRTWQPSLMTDYICRVRDEPLDKAVEMLVDYL
jgi:hypothetical protein